MTGVDLPKGYSLEERVFTKEVKGENGQYTYTLSGTVLLKEGRIVLLLPSGHYSDEKVLKIIDQVEKAKERRE